MHCVYVVIPIVIDRSSPVPLYHQLAEQLTAAIEDGTLQPGDPFENELALAERLELSRPTVRRAIGELVARGMLVRRRGIGTTIANQVIHRRDELTSLYEDLQRSGRSPLTEVLTARTDAVDESVAEILGLPADTPLVSLKRLRYADGMPLAILRNWLPPAFADLTVESLTQHSLYALLRERGVRPIVAHQSIGARRPLPRERKLLHLVKGDPLLTMTRKAYDAAGAAVEFGDHCYRFDQYAFDITVHEGFDFWVEGHDVSGEAAASLERANESVVPTTPIEGTPATYWCRIGERTYIRLVLADDEDTATTALARLHAKGEAHLDEDRRLLGAFRAGGLIVPVWEVPADSEPADHAGVVADFTERYCAARDATDDLTADERRARSGLLSRQVTLR